MTDRSAGTALQVRRLFDAKAAGWPEKYTPGGPLVGRLSRLADGASAEITAGGTVLDLGCGTGELAGAAAGMRATGCDISGEMLRIAKAADLDPARAGLAEPAVHVGDFRRGYRLERLGVRG